METLRQPSHDRFMITAMADVGALRRALPHYAAQLSVTPVRLAQAELVATELATNLLQHAEPGGWILARPVPPAGIELIAVDRGPGIADPAAAVAGRTAAPRGLGCGLATVRRTASRLDLYTQPGLGTTVLALLDLSGRDAAVPPRAWAGVSVAATVGCGDGWAVADLGRETSVLVIDGLGHGAVASVAADAAISAFATAPMELDGFAERANLAMRTTRGGVAVVCRVRPDHGELHHNGVGNISTRIVSGPRVKALTCHNGTLGVRAVAPRAVTQCHPWASGDALVLWTDGLIRGVDLGRYPDLFTHDPGVIAATLHRDFSRESDDATVVVLRQLGPP